jgi:hypothetical protein
LKVTTTTLYKEEASVGFNDFVLFMVVLVALFIAVGLAAKMLHHRFTKPNSAETPIRPKKDSSLQEKPAPKPQDRQIFPVLSALTEALSLIYGAVAKFLHTLFIRKKKAAEKPVQVKKEVSLQDLLPPKPQEQKSPLIAAEEKTVNEYKEALNTLIDEEKNLPVVVHHENTLPAIDEEHKEFLQDLKTLEKEGKRKN